MNKNDRPIQLHYALRLFTELQQYQPSNHVHVIASIKNAVSIIVIHQAYMQHHQVNE